jgi:flagellar hook-associated protein 1 FlgK
MPGLLTTLGSTATALNADSAAINITSNNIANANNPNYAEEVAVFNDLGMVETEEGPQSIGVSVTTTQQTSAVLNAMVQLEASLTSGYTAQQTVLQQAQASLGDSVSSSSTTGSASSTTSESGLGSAIDSFFNAFQSYAADPTDQGVQNSLVQQATVLTDRFQEIDQNLAEVQTGAQSQVTTDVSTANNLLSQVATLNGQIASLEVNNPGSAVDLRDTREADLEQLAGLMPITVTQGSNGEDQVSSGGVTLVSAGTVANSLSYNSGTGVISPGSTALSLTSGSIQGTLSASSGGVQDLRNSIDALANQIVTSVNAAYNPGSTVGGNFFDSTGTTAATIALDSNLSASTLTAGPTGGSDNTTALAVAALANQQFSTGSGDAIQGTFDSSYADAVSAVGNALDTANTQVTNQTNIQTIVSNERASVSGVSIDNEMTNLMTYQRAYQASSEVFQVVNDLLYTVVSSLVTAN